MREYVHGGDIYRHPGMLDFSANINPLGTPAGVVRAAAESMERIGCYPDARREELTAALSAWEDVPPSWLTFGNGAAELIYALVHAVRPRRALVMRPSFAEYEAALFAAGSEIIACDLREEDGFSPGRGVLEQMKDGVSLVFWCNPNNPTGVVSHQELLRDLVALSRKRGVILAVDECFLDFVADGGERTLKPYLRENPQIILLKAFTKRYAMPGLRLGYGLCSDGALLCALERQLQPWNISVPAQAAGIAALLEDAYLKRSLEVVGRERAYLGDGLRRLGCRVYDSRANYLFFKSRADLAERLLKEGILIRDCSNYPGLGKGYFRAAVRRHEENERLVGALSQALEMTKG